MAKNGHRKQYGADVKARAALEAIRGMRTVNEISSDYGIHPTQIAKWKKQVVEGAMDIFSKQREGAAKSEEDLKATLYQQIGQLKVELDWLKKKSGLWGL